MKKEGNKFDFYKTEVYFDSTIVFKYVMDSISFDHTRYVNDYCDYQAYKSGKVKWHKLFLSEGNPLNIYKSNYANKYLSEFSSKKIHVRIVVSDKNNNSKLFHRRRCRVGWHDPNMIFAAVRTSSLFNSAAW